MLDPSVKFRKAYRYAAQARWNIERRLRRCDRFSRAFLGLLAFDGNATEAQRRAAAYLMISFEQDGVNLQHNGIYRDDPEAFLELQKVRAAVFNISLIWDQNIDKDMEKRAYLIRDKSELEGVPEWILRDAAEGALLAGYAKATAADGPWLVSMHDAVVDGVLRHGKSRALRELVHENKARVAFLGGAGRGDNTPMLEQLLRARRRFANVVGYDSHADVVFTRTMATPRQAYGLLAKVRQEALPVARADLEELSNLAKRHGEELDHFDVEYWRERLLEERYGLNESYVRQFFTLDTVLQGLFQLLRELFDVEAGRFSCRTSFSGARRGERLEVGQRRPLLPAPQLFGPAAGGLLLLGRPPQGRQAPGLLGLDDPGLFAALGRPPRAPKARGAPGHGPGAASGELEPQRAGEALRHLRGRSKGALLRTRGRRDLMETRWRDDVIARKRCCLNMIYIACIYICISVCSSIVHPVCPNIVDVYRFYSRSLARVAFQA